MKKRTTCYAQSPSVYEVAPCNCGSDNTTWSEYEEHLWCFDCEQDFKPKHYGIFDGPIPYETAKMFGVYFYKIDLKTNDYLAPNLDFSYQKVINLDNNSFSFDIYLISGNKNHKIKANLNYDGEQISFYTNEDLKDEKYYSNVTTFNKYTKFKDWELSFIIKDNKIILEYSDSITELNHLLLKAYLEHQLPEKEKGTFNKI